MARVKRAVNAQKKKRKIMKLAKGYFGAKSKQSRAASEQVRRSLRYAYIGRKQKKRDFRRLWIARINAAARINGLSYSKLMNGLKVAGVDINRKMLAELAISDANAFASDKRDPGFSEANLRKDRGFLRGGNHSSRRVTSTSMLTSLSSQCARQS